MRIHRAGLIAFSVMTLQPVFLSAQNPAQLDVLIGTQLASGLNLGINTSGGLTNWLTQEPPPPAPGDLKMVYPGGQAWCAMFVTFGTPVNPPRPGTDLSGYQTLIVEISGDPGTTIDVGVKDATQPDDGTEAKVTLPVTSNWTTYAIPLSQLPGANLKDIYVLCEFVFAGGPQPQTVRVRAITYTTAPAPNPMSIQSAASYVTSAGANTWVSVFGQSLSSSSSGWTSGDFQQNILPTALDGTGISVNGLPMAISYVSPAQINALIFSDVPAGPAYVSVTSALGSSVPLLVNIQTLLPGLFTLSPPNAKYAAAVAVSDGAYIGPPGVLGAGVETRPAKPGEIIELYGTGFGPTNPPDTPGILLQSALPLANSSQVTVLFGTAPSPEVPFAGLSAPGLYQFNVVVPNVADGDQPLLVNIGNAASQPNVFVTVKN
jgi:uncharacterized protein (TIGR03437 family)